MHLTANLLVVFPEYELCKHRFGVTLLSLSFPAKSLLFHYANKKTKQWSFQSKEGITERLVVAVPCSAACRKAAAVQQ